MIQTGVAGYSRVTSRDWNLSAGAGERTFQSPDIAFAPPFAAPPRIVLALSGLDSDQATNLRVEVYPHDVESEEFNIIIKTWADTVLYGVQVMWIACEGE